MILNVIKPFRINGRPVGVALIGAGFAARGFALQCIRSKELRLIGIANRTVAHASRLVSDIGSDIQSIRISDDPLEIVASKDVDVVVEATGDVEFGAVVSIMAIKHHKHVVLINAELDATLGPILKNMADDEGVVYTQAYGDQPGVIMTIVHEVESMGLKPVVAGNIKTFFDRYRNPDTQRDWAAANGVSPILATNAVDGTKLSVEMATVANATGFSVAVRGMYGPKVSRVEDAVSVYQKLMSRNNDGIVDYILGATPPFGVFVIAYTDDTLMRKYLKLYKMGDGPNYLFYRPYHLCTLESQISVVNAALSHAATMAPIGMTCEVISVAKRNLKKGEFLDGIGGYTVYGVAENSLVARKDALLPIGLSKGCIISHDLMKDDVISYRDVVIPNGRLVDRLYKKQISRFIP